MHALFVFYWSVSLIAYSFDQVWPALLPVFAGILSIWDRAGIPVALVTALAMAQSPAQWWMVLIMCITGGIFGDLICYLLGRSLSHTHLAQSTNPFVNKGGWRYWVKKYSPFVQVAPQTWCLMSRLFPAFNQWVHVALGVVRYSATKHLSLSIIGNIIWLGAWAFLSNKSSAYISQFNQEWKWTLLLVGIILMIGSLWFVQAKVQQTIDQQSSRKPKP